jgi:magnesium transporter
MCSTAYTLPQLLALYRNTPFVVYVVLIVCYLFAAFICLLIIRKRVAQGRPRPYDHKFESFAYPSLAGTFGAHSVLFAKSSAEIVKTTAAGNNQFHDAASFFLCFGLVACLLLQIRLLNEGLMKADALFVVPVYQVCWVVMNTVVGMVRPLLTTPCDPAHRCL